MTDLGAECKTHGHVLLYMPFSQALILVDKIFHLQNLSICNSDEKDKISLNRKTNEKNKNQDKQNKQNKENKQT